MSGKILVVDPDRHLTTLLEFLLSQAGHTVRVTDNSADALELARAFAPDLILMEVLLPDAEGFELCRALREDPRLAGIRLVLLSALGRKNDAARGLACGADAYITKPFSKSELFEQLESLERDGGDGGEDGGDGGEDGGEVGEDGGDVTPPYPMDGRSCGS